MKKINSLFLSPIIILSVFSLYTKAYAIDMSAEIESLPGEYAGKDQNNSIPCSVTIKKNSNALEFTIKQNENEMNFTIADIDHELKKYEDWRKTKDKKFDSNINAPALAIQKTKGRPNFFGIYPETHSQLISWKSPSEKNSNGLIDLFEVSAAVSKSNGAPINYTGSSTELKCMYLVKKINIGLTLKR